jgi:MFS family permease
MFLLQGFTWSPAQQGVIFSSFLWFYPFTNFMGAYFSEEFDNKKTIFVLVLGSSLLTFCTPSLVYWGDQVMLTLTRLLQGAFQVRYDSEI